MPRTTFAPALLLAVLALSQGEAVAEPLTLASGKMVFDEVGAGLDRYRKENDSEKRAKWLLKLARTRDPRLVVALGEVMEMAEQAEPLELLSAVLAIQEYCSEGGAPFRWCEAHEADLRRRAARLPRWDNVRKVAHFGEG